MNLKKNHVPAVFVFIPQCWRGKFNVVFNNGKYIGIMATSYQSYKVPGCMNQYLVIVNVQELNLIDTPKTEDAIQATRVN